jgi:hypothetical protein
VSFRRAVDFGVPINFSYDAEVSYLWLDPELASIRRLG